MQIDSFSNYYKPHRYQPSLKVPDGCLLIFIMYICEADLKESVLNQVINKHEIELKNSSERERERKLDNRQW